MAKKNKPAQSAITNIQKIAEIELPFTIDRYPKSRYSLVECKPMTGRKHQIRRHLKHIGHPIIGDAKHGKGRHNRYFKEHLNAGRLLLAATELTIMHPTLKQPLTLTAPLDTILKQLFIQFHWQHTINPQLMA